MRPTPLLLSAALLLPAAAAQDPGDQVLTIATKETPPFVVRDGEGWTGLSIELWRMVEDRLGTRSRFVERDLQAMIDETAAGNVDLAVAALTVTADREAILDFTHPFLSSGLGIATRAEERSLVVAIIDRLVSPDLLNAVLALALVLAVCGFVVWLLERRANPDHFGGKGLRGFGAGFWFSAVTMTTVGYGDKAPVTVGGRAVALVWMFASVIIISSYTAAIASALTVEGMNAVVRGPEDLPRARIGTVNGSAAVDWLREQRLAFDGYADLPAAMTDLEEGDLEAVVYDAPILRSLTTEGGGIKVLPHVLRHESYAFAMPPDRPLREDLNRALLEALGTDRWTALRERYLGK